MVLPLQLSSSKPHKQSLSTKQVILAAISLVIAFYAGILVGLHVGSPSNESPALDNDVTKDPAFKDAVNQRVQKEIALKLKEANIEVKKKRPLRFSEGMSNFALGAVRTSKVEFNSLYDNGYPDDHVGDKGAEDVLILYNKKDAFPSGAADSAMHEDGTGMLKLSAKEATENCESLHVVSTKSMGGAHTQCVAIVGEYPSFHIRPWMRTKNHVKQEVSPDLPLVPVSRGRQTNGADQFEPPMQKHINKNWDLIRKYLDSIEHLTENLKPILKKIAIKNTVIVMVCNFGQAELLANFACAAKAKGLDISNVLVFATDKDTFDVATALGVTSFYDEMMFDEIPEKEAAHYGDKVFRDMMYAKVLSVQLVNMLGYDLLFQDVDIVWWKNPVELFHDKSSPYNDFDMLFQDDGARSIRYAPYSANSGFYYVRHNPRTTYLLASLLHAGDLVISTGSHQQALTALLSEHSSLYNLRVKTMKGEDFPGGYHYHRDQGLMHNIAQGKIEPLIFHMSWTDNKDNKLKFLKQMGLWFLTPKCEGSGLQEELHQTEVKVKYQAACCAAEPLFTCFYKDKPSVSSCNDSPAIDKHGKSFWK